VAIVATAHRVHEVTAETDKRVILSTKIQGNRGNREALLNAAFIPIWKLCAATGCE